MSNNEISHVKRNPSKPKVEDIDNWYGFFRNKQSNQWNSIHAILIGALFGVFSIEQPVFVIPLAVLLIVSLSFFYQRYFSYYILEQVALFQAKLKVHDYIKAAASVAIPRRPLYWEDQEFIKLIFYKIAPKSIRVKIITRVAPKNVLELFGYCIFWGILFLSWLFWNPPKDISLIIVGIITLIICVIRYSTNDQILCQEWKKEQKEELIKALNDLKTSKKEKITFTSDLAKYLTKRLKKKEDQKLFFNDLRTDKDEVVNISQALINFNVITHNNGVMCVNVDILTEFFKRYRIFRKVSSREYAVKMVQGMDYLNKKYNNTFHSLKDVLEERLDFIDF